MQFFSEDYLMHYGIKGMKWKKKKGNQDVKSPDEYLADAYAQVSPEGWRRAVDLRNGGSGAKWTKDHMRSMLNETNGSRNGDIYRKYRRMESIANANRRADIKKARKKAYKKNQRRIARQQLKAKIQRRYDKLTGHNGVTVTHDTHVTSVHGGRR